MFIMLLMLFTSSKRELPDWNFCVWLKVGCVLTDFCCCEELRWLECCCILLGQGFSGAMLLDLRGWLCVDLLMDVLCEEE